MRFLLSRVSFYKMRSGIRRSFQSSTENNLVYARGNSFVYLEDKRRVFYSFKNRITLLTGDNLNCNIPLWVLFQSKINQLKDG